MLFRRDKTITLTTNLEKLLDRLKNEEREAFVEVIRSHMNVLKKATTGRQIQAIERLISASAGVTVEADKVHPAPGHGGSERAATRVQHANALAAVQGGDGSGPAENPEADRPVP